MEYETYKNDELYHYGILGMKWGVRRYQRKDGSLTPAGEKRRAKLEAELKSRERVIKNKERTQAKISKLAAKKAELDEREDALNGDKNKKNSKAKSNANSDPAVRKSVKDMTDDELREYTTRMQLESNYYNAQKNLATAAPQKVSAGQKFMKSVLNDVIAPAAKNVGKTYLENLLKDKLGLKDSPKLSVEDQVKKFKLEQDKKNVELEDLRREIATYEAKKRLKKERAQWESDD